MLRLHCVSSVWSRAISWLPADGAVDQLRVTIVFRICFCTGVILADDVESEGPSRAAGGGFVDRLPVWGAFIEFQCVCTSVPTLSWGQY
jgi:hypothetical protein